MISDFLDWIQVFVRQVIGTLGYPGIFLVMLVENLFPPIPSEVVMPFAGFLVAEGRMSFPGVLLSGTLGAWLGAAALYYVGRWLGAARLSEWVRKYGKYFLVGEQDLDKTLEFFDRYGEAAVLFGRLVPGVRSLISIPAGITGSRLGVFLALTFVGTTLWNVLLLSAGVFLGRRWSQVLAFAETYSTLINILLGLLLAAFVVYRLRQRLQKGAG